MKYLIAALFSLATVGAFTPLYAGELAITIDGIKKASGTLVVTVMNEAAWNGKATPLVVRNVAAQGAIDGKGKLAVTIAGLPEGIYAVAVIHDANDNHKLDTGFMGIPTEGWGNSNNPKVWRKPYFSEVKVDVGPAPVPVLIHLH